MTVGETVLLIGLLVNALAILISSRKVAVVIADVKKIEEATNSMKDELVEATKSAALLQGKEIARQEIDAEIKQLGVGEQAMKLYVLDNNGAMIFEFIDMNGGERLLAASQEAKIKVTALVEVALKFLQLKEE